MHKNIYTLIAVILLISCASEPAYDSDFKSYLNQHGVIDLNDMISGLGDAYINLGRAALNDHQGLVMYDQVSMSFKHVDFEGNLLNTFGSQGRGPFEFQMFTKTYLSNNGDFYVFDTGMSKIITYRSNGEMSEFFIEKSLVDLAVNRNGDILVYHLSVDSEYVLTLYDASGNEIISAFTPNDEPLKLFLSRYRDGGLSYSFEDDLFYFLYPENYEIVVLNNSLDIVRTIPLQAQSTFPNGLLPMPQNLNPFGMSPSHIDYWSSFHHPADLSLYDSEYFLVKNYEMIDQNDWQIYYNLFSNDGEPVFEGVIIPDSLGIIHADSRYINLSRENEITRFRIP